MPTPAPAAVDLWPNYAYPHLSYQIHFVYQVSRDKVHLVRFVRLLSSRQLRFLSLAVAALLVSDAAAAYQVGVRAKRPPAFRKGGRFLEALGDQPGVPSAPGNTTTTSTAVAPATDSTSASSAQTPTTRPRTASADASLSSASRPTGGGSNASSKGPLPATGTYTWAASGTESASGFGSRDFPPTMTMVAHKDAGLRPEEIVLDSTYSSNHSEREILGVESDGIYFDFEAGQVRFGPSAQTNQGDYRPPMLQVPFPLAAGVVRTGTSKALASDGSTQRTENWTVKVIDQEMIQAAGVSVLTWKITIDRHGSGSNQQVDRSRVLWYYPARHLWVKYTEKMHGQQNYGITFTYDENLTATLHSFTAS